MNTKASEMTKRCKTRKTHQATTKTQTNNYKNIQARNRHNVTTSAHKTTTTRGKKRDTKQNQVTPSDFKESKTAELPNNYTTSNNQEIQRYSRGMSVDYTDSFSITHRQQVEK